MSRTARRIAVFSWGTLGLSLLFVEPAMRLGHAAARALGRGMSVEEWAAFAVIVLLIGYAEGYRSFHRSFCPRAIERAWQLRDERSGLRVALAPLHAAALVGGNRRSLARAWALVALIVGCIIAVHRLPPTLRAMVDGAVALSLAWGTAVLVIGWFSRLRGLLGTPEKPAHASIAPPPRP